MAVPAFLENLPPLSGPRAVALKRFIERGLPTQREEDWRYTSVYGLQSATFKARAAAQPKAILAEAPALLLVDGVLLAPDRLPDGVRVAKQDNLFADPPAGLADLNAALAEGCVHLTVAAGQQVAVPVQIVHAVATGGMAHAQLRVTLEQGAQLTIVERFQGVEAFATLKVQVEVAPGAKLHWVGVQDEAAGGWQLRQQHVSVGERGEFNAWWLNLGGRLTRQKMTVLLQGREASTNIHALNLARGGHVDLLTSVKLAAQGTRSEQTVRALAGSKGRAVFQGRIFVAQEGQQTDARQNHRGLLLDDAGEIDAKPGLEIYADDVKCGHGSTCGALDEEALFYLRSRGIPLDEAQALLLAAFTGDALEGLPDGALRGLLEARIAAALGSEAA